MPTAASASGRSAAPVDVLIVTAIRLEYDAAREVKTGALGEWAEDRSAVTGLRIDRRDFHAADGGVLRVALICGEDLMGGTATAAIAGPVIQALRPRCLAMCGVLGGKPGDTEFGDVIFADQLLLHDSGKNTEAGFEHATRPHALELRWLERAHDFAKDPGDALAWLAGDPWSEEQEKAWLLDQFFRGFDPTKHPALVDECCTRYEALVDALLTEGLVQPPSEGPPLTDKGKAHVAGLRFKKPRWPNLDPPRRGANVHVGPIASGNAVQADPALWTELKGFARKTLGVEMEGDAVATAAEVHRVPLALVLKGVMDHTNKDKDDRFKPFAARVGRVPARLRAPLPPDGRASWLRRPAHPGYGHAARDPRALATARRALRGGPLA